MQECDGLEFRSPALRRQQGMEKLAQVIHAARLGSDFWAARLSGIEVADPDSSAEASANGTAAPNAGPATGAPLTQAQFTAIPVLRKAELPGLQAAHPPFGGLSALPAGRFPRLFLSPGPICEPGALGDSGAERALRAAGLRGGMSF